MTIQELSKQIDDQNLSFRKANKARKRVMIAKDTIARVVAQQLVVEADNAIIDKLDASFGSLKDALCNFDDEFCKVCAKGALFMSYVGRVNDVNVEDVHPDSFQHLSNNNPIIEKLSNIFSEEQLILVEAAFEGKQIVPYTSKGEYVDLGGFDYRTFHHNYYKDDDRLIAICQNIIKNKGTFVL